MKMMTRFAGVRIASIVVVTIVIFAVDSTAAKRKFFSNFYYILHEFIKPLVDFLILKNEQNCSIFSFLIRGHGKIRIFLTLASFLSCK